MKKVSYSALPEYAKQEIDKVSIKKIANKYKSLPIHKTNIDKTEYYFRFRQHNPNLFAYLFTIKLGENRIIVGNLKSNKHRRVQSILIARL